MKKTFVLFLIVLISLSVFASGVWAQTNVDLDEDLIEVEFQDEGTLNVEGWEHTSKTFKFTCSGPADLQNTPCYGKSPPQSGEITAPGPYTLISRKYSCETPDFKGVCEVNTAECGFTYEGKESEESVEARGAIDDWANLVRGSLNIKYTCSTCGHGVYVWYVKPTNCTVDIYTKSYSSCNELCQSTIQGAIGKEIAPRQGADKECKCYCEKGAEPLLQSNDLWTCTTGDEPFLPFGSEIYVQDCIDAPELCHLPKEIRDRIIDWFYMVLMEHLDGNYMHTITYKDAEGGWHINWGMPWGWTQRVVINGYKGIAQTKVKDGDLFKEFDKNKWWGKTLNWLQVPPAYAWKVLTHANLDANANIPEKSGMGTCGDVMAYLTREFKNDFPGVKITTVAMAWEGWIFSHDHAANLVLPVNPKTGKQYNQDEVPQAVFLAETGDDLPKEWQNAVVLDGWGRRITSFKDWFNEYKHGDGEVAVGD